MAGTRLEGGGPDMDDSSTTAEPKITKLTNGYMMRFYGISLDDYKKMFDFQEGKCAICRKDFSQRNFKSLHVDHDHRTRTVRGLLCTKCNTILGMSGDDVLVLRSAIRYLEDHPSRDCGIETRHNVAKREYSRTPANQVESATYLECPQFSNSPDLLK